MRGGNGWGGTTICQGSHKGRGVRAGCTGEHQHQQSDDKVTKLRLRFLPSPKCRVRLQRGRQQQPAHKNERRGALYAAAAMRSIAP